MKEIFDQVSIQCSRFTTKSYSTSFSLGILCLDKSLRDPIYSIYGFVNAKTLAQADSVSTYYYRILETSDSHASWYRLLKNRTYDSVTKLSRYYAGRLSKLNELNAARNNQVECRAFLAICLSNLLDDSSSLRMRSFSFCKSKICESFA